MPSANEAIIAAAGGGKTSRIVEQALGATDERAALVTYTNNNADVMRKMISATGVVMPPHLEVATWYSFLLHDLARPYQRAMTERRIDGFSWEQGQSTQGIPKSNVGAYYFAGSEMYSDKMSDFVCECERRTSGMVIGRLQDRFDHIYIDEVQDLAGYDLDLIELILKSKIKVTLVGDHRQATFRTHHSTRNKQYRGQNIVKKFEEWEKQGLLTVRRENETHRCHQVIADLADLFYPGEPATVSLNKTDTGHSGVFAIKHSEVEEYVRRYAPQVLRLSKTTPCAGLEALNFGIAKGLTFDRVLIFPHGKGKVWLKSGDFSHVEGSVAEMYVGVTRARHSVTFVFDDDLNVQGIARCSVVAA